MTELPKNPDSDAAQPASPTPDSHDVDDVETVTSADPAETDTLRGSPFDSMIGQKIGRYTIRSIIGSGGMGTVFEAQQEQPRRRVAIKMMKRGMTSRSALRRFEFESQLLGRLQHPGVAQVYEAGTHDDGSGGVPYFAMEYIANAKTLTQYALDKKLGTRERLTIFAQVCDAVQHGHLKGIVHRDLKPGNILVDASGQPKIIDFGVARSTDSDMAVTTLQTDVGQLVGTLQYMSPEQVEADPHDIDARSDVYAMGVILYELLANSLPYDLKEAAIHEAARMVREEMPTKLSTIDRRLRGDVETIALKALEKDRDRRYQSATAMEEDIKRYLVGDPIAARRATAWYHMKRFAQRHKAAVIFVVSFMFLLMIATGVSLILLNDAINWKANALRMRDQALQGQHIAEQQTREAEEAKEAAELAQADALQQAYLGNLRAASAAADRYAVVEANRRLEAARTARGNLPVDEMPFEWQYLSASINHAVRTISTGSAMVYSLGFSANGSQLRSFSLTKGDYRSQIWDVYAGMEVIAPVGSAWSNIDVDKPDDSELCARIDFVNDNAAIWDLRSGEQIATLDNGWTKGYRFVFSAGGRCVAGQDGHSIRVWDVATGSELQSHPVESYSIEYALSPDGKHIAVERRAPAFKGCWIEIRDTSSGELVASIGNGTDPPASCFESASISVMAFSPDGRSLAAVDRDGVTRIIDIEMSQVRVTMRGESDYEPALSGVGLSGPLVFSPDGKKLILSTLHSVIRVWDVETGEILNTFHGHRERIQCMVVSADGMRLASGSAEGNIRIWGLDDFDGLSQIISRSDSKFDVSSLSPDGTQLATSNVWGGVDLWNLKTSELIARFESNEPFSTNNFSYSPDGLQLAIAGIRGDVWICDMLTGERRALLPITDGFAFTALSYSPDGQLLAVGGRNKNTEVFDPKTGELKYELPSREFADEELAFSSDGSVLATLSPSVTSGPSFWNAASGERLSGGVSRDLLENQAEHFTLSPVVNHIAVDNYGGSIQIREFPSELAIVNLSGHEGDVQALSYSPKGNRLASVGEDRLVRLWDPISGEELITLASGKDALKSISFSPDGTMLVGTDGRKRIFFWDTRTQGQRGVDRKLAIALERKLEPIVATWLGRADGDSELVVALLEKDLKDRTPEEASVLRNLVLKKLVERRQSAQAGEAATVMP